MVIVEEFNQGKTPFTKTLLNNTTILIEWHFMNVMLPKTFKKEKRQRETKRGGGAIECINSIKNSLTK